MKLKFLFFFVFLSLLALASAWAQPKISLSQESQFDLGALDEGEIYKQVFPISNLGDSGLELKAVTASCGCTAIVYPKKRVKVAPHKSIGLRFNFNTEGMDEGEVVKYIYIESNDPQNPKLRLKLTALIKKDPAAVNKRFMSFEAFTVMTAGLIDGVNPCAFTALVFFVSFLSLVGYRRKELLVLGSSFISAVFITYILLGLGLFKFIRALEAFSILSRVVYLAIAALTIILGLYSLYDWYIYRKTGDPDETKLRLPNFIKLKTQKIIQDSSRNKKRTMVELAAAIFLSGFLVSILESLCTGQTYLPTIVYVLKTPALRLSALFYLVVYNIMFIIPLGLIFITALLGTKSEVFSKLAKKHLGIIKLLTAGLFFLLGILLLKAKGG